MEDKLKNIDIADDYKEVAMGICFGSGAGIVLGAIFNNVGFGFSVGGVMGIIVGSVVRVLRKIK
jgi:uncharacterized membrane protein